MGYPITDVLTGRPAGAEPVIRTLAKRQHRASLRARYVIVLPAGDAAPEHSVLFLPRHELRRVYGGPASLVDVYRSRSQGCGTPIAEAIAERPVSDQEIAACRKAEPQVCGYLHDDGVASIVRSARGDLSQIGWWDSPWTMDWDTAATAAIAGMGTEHLYCGVREEHGRWQAYRGLGGHLVIVGTADTQPEAEMIARAELLSAWLARVREIEALRGGDLSWGQPVPSPANWLMVGDPQKEY